MTSVEMGHATFSDQITESRDASEQRYFTLKPCRSPVALRNTLAASQALAQRPVAVCNCKERHHRLFPDFSTCRMDSLGPRA